MPDNQVTKDFNVKLHGSGVAHCGSYPVIKAVGSITFTRNPGSNQVSWYVSGMSRGNCLPTSTTAKFGYRFLAYIEVNGTRQPLIIKDNIQASGWTSSKYTQIYTPSGTFTSTDSTTTIKFVCKGNTCMSNNAYCYRTSGYQTIATYVIDLPSYQTEFAVSYDGNGGTPNPATQYKDIDSDLTLTTDIPTNQVNLNYHNASPYVDHANRSFVEWNTNQDGSGTSYAPGALYQTNADCVLYAQWGTASFVPIAMAEDYLTVTYNANGGTVIPASTLVPKAKLGYDDDASASTVDYVVGTTYTTTTDLDLYPVYGNATLRASDMPTPTFIGHVFEGWYRDSQLTSKITDESPLVTATNTTVYAKWIPLPVRKFTNNEWTSETQYVWKFNASANEWQKVAHVFVYSSGRWIDISV